MWQRLGDVKSLVELRMRLRARASPRLSVALRRVPNWSRMAGFAVRGLALRSSTSKVKPHVVAVVAVLLLDDDFHRAHVIYGALFVFGIVVPSILVLARRKVGFPSLFVTVAHLRERHDLKAVLATVVLSAGLAILVIHLAFYPWPEITKAPVEYAGLTANDAKPKANREVKKGQPDLKYSTQTRGVLNAHEAWIVFFTSSDGADSGCVVTLTDKSVETTEQCKT